MTTATLEDVIVQTIIIQTMKYCTHLDHENYEEFNINMAQW